jgi:hypothetical protein
MGYYTWGFDNEVTAKILSRFMGMRVPTLILILAFLKFFAWRDMGAVVFSFFITYNK